MNKEQLWYARRRDIENIIMNELPYYQSEDKDDYHYFVKKKDVERLAKKIEQWLKGQLRSKL